MAEKTILITGGAGFIGSHVIRRFVNKYFEVSSIGASVDGIATKFKFSKRFISKSIDGSGPDKLR